MENKNHALRAKKVMEEIGKIIEAKGLDLPTALMNGGISSVEVEHIVSGKKLPSLSEFFLLCEISGIDLQFPYVETPKNPM